MIRRVSQHGVTSLFTTGDLSISPARVIRGGPQPHDNNEGFTRLRGQSNASTNAIKERAYPAGVVKNGSSKAAGSPAVSADSLRDRDDIELGTVGVRKDIYVAHGDRI